MLPHILRDHASRLGRVLGREQARLELRWMLQALRPSGPGAATASDNDSGNTQKLSAMVARRVAGEPLQYILGTQPFGALTLLARAPVLIPRPETEDWTMRLARHVRPARARPARLLDLCTGSGCIPLLLCALWPPGSVRAVGWTWRRRRCGWRGRTRRCAACLRRGRWGWGRGRGGGGEGVNTFVAVQADMRDPAFLARVSPPFDVVTANPPYIPRDEYDALPRSVKDYEDVRALLGDPDPDTDSSPGATGSGGNMGLTFYHAIADLVARRGVLAGGGTLAVEVGKGQAGHVERILRREAGLGKTEVWKDPWGVERVVVASRGS